MKKESQVIREIGTYLETLPCLFWRSNNIPAGGRHFGSMRALPKYTPRGIPDFCMVMNGRFYGIEAKRPPSDEREVNGRKVRAGALTPDQVRFGEDIEANGGRYLVVHSLQELRDALK